MARPTFILLEPEPEQALSSRKLVLETAKFNVITAHSGGECLELMKLFARTDALIAHSEVRDVPCERLFQIAKLDYPSRATIFLNAIPASTCAGADHAISSHDPEALLFLLRRLFGDPRGGLQDNS